MIKELKVRELKWINKYFYFTCIVKDIKNITNYFTFEPCLYKFKYKMYFTVSREIHKN